MIFCLSHPLLPHGRKDRSWHLGHPALKCSGDGHESKSTCLYFPGRPEKGDIVTDLPGGKKLTLTMRDVDLDAVDKLRKMQGITVLGTRMKSGLSSKYIEIKK